MSLAAKKGGQSGMDMYAGLELCVQYPAQLIGQLLNMAEGGALSTSWEQLSPLLLASRDLEGAATARGILAIYNRIIESPGGVASAVLSGLKDPANLINKAWQQQHLHIVQTPPVSVSLAFPPVQQSNSQHMSPQPKVYNNKTIPQASNLHSATSRQVAASISDGAVRPAAQPAARDNLQHKPRSDQVQLNGNALQEIAKRAVKVDGHRVEHHVKSSEGDSPKENVKTKGKMKASTPGGVLAEVLKAPEIIDPVKLGTHKSHAPSANGHTHVQPSAAAGKSAGRNEDIGNKATASSSNTLGTNREEWDKLAQGRHEISRKEFKELLKKGMSSPDGGPADDDILDDMVNESDACKGKESFCLEDFELFIAEVTKSVNVVEVDGTATAAATSSTKAAAEDLSHGVILGGKVTNKKDVAGKDGSKPKYFLIMESAPGVADVYVPRNIFTGWDLHAYHQIVKGDRLVVKAVPHVQGGNKWRAVTFIDRKPKGAKEDEDDVPYNLHTVAQQHMPHNVAAQNNGHASAQARINILAQSPHAFAHNTHAHTHADMMTSHPDHIANVLSGDAIGRVADGSTVSMSTTDDVTGRVVVGEAAGIKRAGQVPGVAGGGRGGGISKSAKPKSRMDMIRKALKQNSASFKPPQATGNGKVDIGSNATTAAAGVSAPKKDVVVKPTTLSKTSSVVRKQTILSVAMPASRRKVRRGGKDDDIIESRVINDRSTGWGDESQKKDIMERIASEIAKGAAVSRSRAQSGDSNGRDSEQVSGGLDPGGSGEGDAHSASHDAVEEHDSACSSAAGNNGTGNIASDINSAGSNTADVNGRHADAPRKDSGASQKQRSNKGKSDARGGRDAGAGKKRKRPDCTFWIKGKCHRGQECTFSHDCAQEGAAATMCKFFLRGECSKGTDCIFSHDLQRWPCKFFHVGKGCARGSKCSFSHRPLTEDQRLWVEREWEINSKERKEEMAQALKTDQEARKRVESGEETWVDFSTAEMGFDEEDDYWFNMPMPATNTSLFTSARDDGDALEASPTASANGGGTPNGAPLFTSLSNDDEHVNGVAAGTSVLGDTEDRSMHVGDRSVHATVDEASLVTSRARDERMMNGEGHHSAGTGVVDTHDVSQRIQHADNGESKAMGTDDGSNDVEQQDQEGSDEGLVINDED